MQSIIRAVHTEIKWKLAWLRETRVLIRELREENPKARIGNVLKFIEREQKDLVKLRKIKQLLKS